MANLCVSVLVDGWEQTVLMTVIFNMEHLLTIQYVVVIRATQGLAVTKNAITTEHVWIKNVVVIRAGGVPGARTRDVLVIPSLVLDTGFVCHLNKNVIVHRVSQKSCTVLDTPYLELKGRLFDGFNKKNS